MIYKMRYTSQEKIDILQINYSCQKKNTELASAEYFSTFINRKQPHRVLLVLVNCGYDRRYGYDRN